MQGMDIDSEDVKYSVIEHTIHMDGVPLAAVDMGVD